MGEGLSRTAVTSLFRMMDYENFLANYRSSYEDQGLSTHYLHIFTLVFWLHFCSHHTSTHVH